ncbi:hypothetical protein [Mycobacterium sp. SMC-8]|uniref:hypothetical protein n=1 Tax=Mycobacterium sp. SMC-8 TaxID=2857060 RepID=UPI0021B2C065|nr:hypothetical protein [Mycobacterium sp. SMC-8]
MRDADWRQTVRGRTFETDDFAQFERRRSGVRIAGETLRTYDLTVFAADVDGVVGAAGGWLCDRARAGWQVTVTIPPGHDTRALRILGVDVEVQESLLEALCGTAGAAVAMDARVLRENAGLRAEMSALADTARAEITVWGDAGSFGPDGRFDRVRHRLSAAARAFKSRALQTTGQIVADLTVEEFVSAALWYPPDGADLVPLPNR